jgi:hypothetical protein
VLAYDTPDRGSLLCLFLLSFLFRAESWTWLHSRSFPCIVLLRPELVKVDRSFLMSRSTWDITLDHIA